MQWPFLSRAFHEQMSALHEERLSVAREKNELLERELTLAREQIAELHKALAEQPEPAEEQPRRLRRPRAEHSAVPTHLDPDDNEALVRQVVRENGRLPAGRLIYLVERMREQIKEARLPSADLATIAPPIPVEGDEHRAEVMERIKSVLAEGEAAGRKAVA